MESIVDVYRHKVDSVPQRLSVICLTIGTILGNVRVVTIGRNSA